MRVEFVIHYSAFHIQHLAPSPLPFRPPSPLAARREPLAGIIPASRRPQKKMSTYLGNDSLSPAVKERVLSTFQQTLALYKQGRMEEVVAGCGLILRMDPQFDPAKKLLDKSRNPQLPIDVDKLGPAAPPAAGT